MSTPGHTVLAARYGVPDPRLGWRLVLFGVLVGAGAGVIGGLGLGVLAVALLAQVQSPGDLASDVGQLAGTTAVVAVVGALLGAVVGLLSGVAALLACIAVRRTVPGRLLWVPALVGALLGTVPCWAITLSIPAVAPAVIIGAAALTVAYGAAFVMRMTIRRRARPVSASRSAEGVLAPE